MAPVLTALMASAAAPRLIMRFAYVSYEISFEQISFAGQISGPGSE
jgi:hypothetical protein